MTPEVSVRRIRTKERGGLAAINGTARTVLGVRYPWAGWGADAYAHRSLAAGAGEPDYTTEPTPSRASRRRVLLSTANSRREMVTWKHTHVWNRKTLLSPDANGYYLLEATDPWWVDAVNDHPETTGGGETWASPQPMSATALWWRIAAADNGDGEWNAPTAGVRFPSIYVMTGNPAIDETMEWTAERYTDSIVRVQRKCSRVLCYKGATHSGGTISVAGITPLILREVGRDGDGYQALADVRFEPFAWGDQLAYGGTANANAYQLDESIGADGPPEGAWNFPEGAFTTADLASLSMAKVSQGFVYSSPHAYNNPFLWSYIENDQPFDLIIEASFYRYKWWKYDSEAAGSGMDKMGLFDSGFAGIYGTCHAIF